MVERVVIVVCDSVGIGAMPDASSFGDEGSNTLGNILQATPGLDLPNLRRLGLGNIAGVPLSPVPEPTGAFGRMAELSCAKDTTSGHWEMMGCVINTAWPTYPDGFPPDVMNEFERQIGTGTLGNIPSSGTTILDQLGEEHMRTGFPIVYTSADSVFQIAAHEEIIPIERLYEICHIARDILVGPHAVARVIARPFVGEPGNFQRTPRRHDYSVVPPATILDRLKDAGQTVYAVGKIDDIFASRGVTEHVSTTSNMDGVDKTLAAMDQVKQGLIFTNLVDFDMLFGHRRNVEGYATALKEFDNRLPEIEARLRETDLLLITADHGCDPTFTQHTDHTREFVPFIAVGPSVQPKDLGTLDGFSNLGRIVLSSLQPEDRGIDAIPGILTWEQIRRP